MKRKGLVNFLLSSLAAGMFLAGCSKDIPPHFRTNEYPSVKCELRQEVRYQAGNTNVYFRYEGINSDGKTFNLDLASGVEKFPIDLDTIRKSWPLYEGGNLKENKNGNLVWQENLFAVEKVDSSQITLRYVGHDID
ncbi:MAG: hypothetical protein AABW50_03755 [Nanoarchaeota archaeon]